MPLFGEGECRAQKRNRFIFRIHTRYALYSAGFRRHNQITRVFKQDPTGALKTRPTFRYRKHTHPKRTRSYGKKLELPRPRRRPVRGLTRPYRIPIHFSAQVVIDRSCASSLTHFFQHPSELRLFLATSSQQLHAPITLGAYSLDTPRESLHPGSRHPEQARQGKKRGESPRSRGRVK